MTTQGKNEANNQEVFMLKRIFNLILSASVVLGTMSTVSLFKAEGANLDEPRIYFFKGFENASDWIPLH